MNPNKKTNYSCIEKKYHGYENPIAKYKRIKRNIIRCYQRIHYGYCESDVWSIDWWFLSVMPNMIDDLRKNTHSYPNRVADTSDNTHAIVKDESTEVDAVKRWNDILSEMAFLLREAHEETCSKDNPYENEHNAVCEEFYKKYGEWGEKLKTSEELTQEKEKHVRIMHTPSNVPEYQQIMNQYYDAEKKLSQYRNECKNKGLDLFKEWFWDLWD